MNNLSAREAFKRSMSHVKYHKYRKSIGKPVPLFTTLCAVARRFFFEWTL